MTHRGKRSPSSLKRREAKKLAKAEAYWDRERHESVALKKIDILGIIRGEVLYDSRGYISPSIEEKF